jgi:WD40 repeat protein
MTLLTTSNPFVGLRPFESSEDFLFFGREEQTLELLQRLHQHHFVAVIGSSGSGKSSLIKAGLIPALEAGYLVNDREHWMIASMKPGQEPLSNLVGAVLEQVKETAEKTTAKEVMEKIKEEGVDALLHLLQPLWKGETNFFLLVDQFEELFRIAINQNEVKSKDEATDFVNILLALAEQKELPVYVVITMRSDFIGDCTQFFGLPEALNKSQYLVPRLTRTQLKTTIEGPVKLFKGKIDPVLTARLLNDSQLVKDELPLLQHALMRTWDYEVDVNKSGELDLTDYEKIGGIEKALSNHADEALTGMSESELALTKKLFQALTTIDENGRKIRRPVCLGELEAVTGAGREQLLSLITRFIEGARSFLVINKSAAEQDWLIDISHESLIRQWGLLSGWVDEEAESVKMYLRLVESTTLYQEKKKDLMSGSELQLAVHWYERFKPLPVWAQRYNPGFENSVQYLKESEKEWLAAEKRKKKYKQNKRILLIGLVIVALVIVALAFFTYQQKQLRLLAQSQANSAQLTAKEANQLRVKAESGFVLARQQSAIADSNAKEAILQTELAVRNAADASNQKQIALKAVAEAILQKKRADENAAEARKLAEFAKTAEQNAITEAQKVTEVKEGYRLNELAREWIEKDPTVALRIEEAAIQKFPNPLFTAALQKYYDRHAFYKVVAEHVDITDTASLSPRSQSLLADAGFRSLIGKKIPPLKGYDEKPFIIAVSPDGEKIATAAHGVYTIKLWDKQGNFIRNFLISSKQPSNSYSVASLTFSPDGKKLFAGYRDYGSAGLWNTEGVGTPLWDMPESNPYKHYMNAGFSPDGKTILISQLNGTTLLWNIEEKKIIDTFRNTGRFTSAVFSRDGKTICTADGASVSLWDLEGNLLNWYKIDDDAGTIAAVAFSEKTNAIFAFSTDSVIRSFNIDGGLKREYKLPLNGNDVQVLAFSPDVKSIFTYTSDKRSTLWSNNGSLQKEINLNHDSVTVAAYSKSGALVLIVTAREKASLWTVDGTLQKEWDLQKQEGRTTTAGAISPDGTRIVTGSSDRTISIWNSNGTLVKVTEKQGIEIPISSMHFTPKGDSILAYSFDDRGRGVYPATDIYTSGGSLLWDTIAQYAMLPQRSSLSAFFDKGKKKISGSEMFSLESATEDRRLWQYPFGKAIALAFSADGSEVITGYTDGTIRIWESAMTLDEFLHSDKIEALTEERKRKFGMK